jgi:hypothetical protein
MNGGSACSVIIVSKPIFLASSVKLANRAGAFEIQYEHCYSGLMQRKIRRVAAASEKP